MRVLIVTGSYPPDKCGVGDYTFQLASALANLPGVEVGVLTTRNSVEPSQLSGVQVYPWIPRWTLRNAGLVRRAISAFRPDVAHIQYPTQGYDGLLARVLPGLVRLCGVRVVQTWHEYFAGNFLFGLVRVLACNGLVYVRPDLHERLPAWVRAMLLSPQVFVPNASSIRPVELTAEEAKRVRRRLSADRALVCYFGFVYAHKGVDRLFEIADPERHHLVLICDLSDAEEYQARILRLAKEPRWAGRVTVTGFLPPRRVAELLAVADAAVFPYTEGTGVWNSSVKAAEDAGVFILATTRDRELVGFHEDTNTFLAACEDQSGMRDALKTHIGRRVKARTADPWKEIARAHGELYRRVCGEN